MTRERSVEILVDLLAEIAAAKEQHSRATTANATNLNRDHKIRAELELTMKATEYKRDMAINIYRAFLDYVAHG